MPLLEERRSCAASVVLCNKGGQQQLLVTGGYGRGGKLSSAELLDLHSQQSSKWITVAPMHQARSWHGICLFRGRVLVAGGFGEDKPPTSSEMFSPPQAIGDPGQWTEFRPMSHLDVGASLTVWKDRLLAFGMFVTSSTSYYCHLMASVFLSIQRSSYKSGCGIMR